MAASLSRYPSDNIEIMAFSAAKIINLEANNLLKRPKSSYVLAAVLTERE